MLDFFLLALSFVCVCVCVCERDFLLYVYGWWNTLLFFSGCCLDEDGFVHGGGINQVVVCTAVEETKKPNWSWGPGYRERDTPES
jgi:hypothetical protein